MKIKIIQDCRLAQLPYEPQLVFSKNQEVDVDSKIGNRLIEAQHAIEIEVGSGNAANDEENSPDKNGNNVEKMQAPDYENKSLGHQKKFSNKSKFREEAK